MSTEGITASEGLKPGRQELRKRRTRAKLVDAARAVMAAKGFEAATIQDITNEADVGFGSFYNYFDSKEAIVDAALDEIVFIFGERVDAFTRDVEDPAEILATATWSYLEMLGTDPVVSQFVVNAGSFKPGVGHGAGGRMIRDLNVGIESGRFTIPDAETGRAMVIGALFGFMRDRLAGRIEATSDRHVVQLILRMLGVPDADAQRLSQELERIPT